MKKYIIMFFVFILILTSLSSCNAGEDNNDNGSGKNLENEVDVMEFDDGLYLDIRNKEDKNSLGVWWWDINDIKQADDLYLNFLEKNNVSEIYLHAYNYQNHGITDDDMKSFVKKAGEKGMRVAYLCGD